MSNDFAAVSDNQEPHIGPYDLLDTTGKVSFIKVRLGQRILTRTDVAVKVIHQQGSSSFQGFLPWEVNCTKTLHHSNIVQLFEMIDTGNTLFLVMERLRRDM